MCSQLRSILPCIPCVLSVLVCRLLHTMQPCLFWTGERAELRITSVELLTEYHLAGVLAHSEVVSGRVEVVQLQGGSVVQRNVICPVSALLPKRAEEGFHFTQHVSLV